MREAGRLARFKSATAEPERTIGLKPDHPAVAENRTLFPSMVVGTFQSRRFLVSADNSSKIGRMVEKGAWAGLPVFTLTLEERKTCPRSCHVYADCFGNSTPFARRNDAFDPDFIPALKAEVVTLVRETCAPIVSRPHWTPPKGLVIRLHVLGDFFSLAYVRMWGELMRFLPELRVYGYTARQPDGDPLSLEIAVALAKLADEFGDRWMIRTSHAEPGPGRTVVVASTEAVELYRSDVILCPAQTKASEACSSCALCWSPNAWDKTIAFLKHGIKTRTAKTPKDRFPKVRAVDPDRALRSRGRHVQTNALGLTPAQNDLLEAMRGLADANGVLQASSTALLRAARISGGNWGPTLQAVLDSRCVQRLQAGRAAHPAIYRVFAEPQVGPEGQADFPPAPMLPAPPRKTPTKIRIADPRPAAHAAQPLVRRAPDAPLMSRPVEGDRGLDAPSERRRPYIVQARYHPRTGALLNPYAIGTAADYDIGTAESRIEALPESEKERIAREYGAVIPKKKAAAE